MSDKTLSFTQRSLAEALDNVRCLSDLGPELIAAQVFAASAQQPAQAVPDGWKLVPVEPTEEMLGAGRNRHLPQMMSGERLALLYRAMIAAAPAAPADVDDECVHEFVPFQAGCTKCGEPYAAAPAAPVAVGREPVARAFGKVCGGDAEHNTVNVRVSGPVPPELWTIGTAVALYAAPPAAEQPGTVAVPRKVLRELTETAIAEWHDPSESEANQDKKECQCCGVQDGHNADCAVSIALHLLGKEGE
ncbi:hypothetical protein OF001_U170061 [Pseudomonas sp. OF001]|uniref:hypothetical protein n=1 Tax=Pseudomonas sp. OF001 TaxID=2772300 RepID=UPI00191AE065|nr:hypothetical protein [Pseudomonas sp. OF001]CAD5376764.1 hypothetical protein OF001_U170061 [Pseudomonas sp. OF001]